MKNIKKRLSSIVALAIIAFLSLSLLFSSLISDSLSASASGETIGDSGISFNGTEYTADVAIGGGTEYHVTEEEGISVLKTYIKAAEPGDIIYLAAGTYSASETDNESDPGAIVMYNSGTYDAYIAILPEDGAEGQVIFDFSAMSFGSSNRGIQVNGSYWYIYGINVTGAGDNGLYVGGSYNVVENCQFYNNRDTGLQLGRSYGSYSDISQWPSYNLIKNCTSYNNYDNETYGENADGFAAKLTVGYGNVFDGCIAYRNSDDGWDLYAYADNGDIGAVIIYNCVAFENGYLMTTQKEFNDSCTFTTSYAESDTNSYTTRDGDGNGFKLGGSVMRGNVKMYNCLSFNNRMHGVTDNSNPGVLNIEGVTSYNNGAAIDNVSTSETFGQIVVGSVSDDYGNFNTARSESSYNNYKNNLSIADEYRSDGLGADEFLGSAENTVFNMGSDTYNYIGSAIDASSYGSGASKVGSAVEGWATAATESEDAEGDVATVAETEDEEEADTTGQINISLLFEELPFYKTTVYVDAEGNEVTEGTEGATATTKYVYNVTGLENYDIHSTYRNSDGSINMDTMLQIKDTSMAASLGIGAYLSESEWNEYTHYYTVSVSNASSEEDAVLTAVYNTLYLYCNTDAVYQDFTLTTSMTGANITWKSSNDDVLHIVKSYNNSNSNSQDVDIEVYRQSTDTEVTLTAYISYNGATCVKTFNIVVKADEPSVGDIYVAEADENNVIIIDQYQTYTEPELIVTNAADNNGKTLADGTYTISSLYEYATSATSAYSKVGMFTSSSAGVYRITKTVTLTGDGSQASYTYYIYVASNDAVIDFTDAAGTLSVYSEGYMLSGDLTNIKGTLYAYSTTSTLDLTSYTTAAEQAAYIATLGDVESYSFTASTITAYFTNSNSAAYNVYYWFANGNGDVTSSVHTQSVSLKTVATTSEFNSMLIEAASSSSTTTIYLLTADIDYEDSCPPSVYETDKDTGDSKEVAGYGRNFYALLNGGGHTVSNINITTSTSNTGLIGKLMGGTIMNIRFLNYTISGASGTGLIGRSYGGYIYKVSMDSVSITGTDRVGGIIGLDSANTTYIDQVSVTGSIVSNGNRPGGIIGHVQLDSAYNTVRAEITNCYVAASISGASYVGGIVARFDDTSDAYSLYIANCYVTSDLVSTNNYIGGILGGQSGSAGSFEIDSCTFLGTITLNGETLVEALKNASGIVGRYAQYAPSTVTNCVSILNQYFDDYAAGVSTDYAASVHRIIRWQADTDDTIMPSYDVSTDGTATWLYLSSYGTGDGYQSRYENREAYAPFIVLQFLVDNGWDESVRCADEAERISVNIGYTTWSKYGYTTYGTTSASDDSSTDSSVTE
ncbi:MAG: hypothetical protein LUD27_04345 [Clostridia bacterium]|nr:hypothetical protein [Clostridia bacterium]